MSSFSLERKKFSTGNQNSVDYIQCVKDAKNLLKKST